MIYKTENKYYLKAQKEKIDLRYLGYQVLHKIFYNFNDLSEVYSLDSHYNFSKLNQRMATIKILNITSIQTKIQSQRNAASSCPCYLLC